MPRGYKASTDLQCFTQAEYQKVLCRDSMALWAPYWMQQAALLERRRAASDSLQSTTDKLLTLRTDSLAAARTRAEAERLSRVRAEEKLSNRTWGLGGATITAILVAVMVVLGR